jgi:hypothetical protein
MKLKGNISILINKEHTTIEVEDKNAAIQFLSITLTPAQLNACLSRQGLVDCELEVKGLEKVGMTHQNRTFEFMIDEKLSSYEVRTHNVELLRQAGQREIDKLGEGWIVSDLFSSQGSFFEKGTQKYARCTIRRWI